MKTLFLSIAALGSLLAASCVTNPSDASSGIPFEIGASELPFGDGLVIESVDSSTEDFSKGAVLTVRGTYDLRSRNRALLYLGTTTSGSPTERGRGPALHTKVIDQGSESFELVHTIPGPGYPHLTFYDLETGHPFGGFYFGSGTTLLNKGELGYGDVAGLESEQ